jgi:hypothetical protein
MSAVRESEPRVPICAQLLRQRLQGIRGIPEDECPDGISTRTSRQPLRQPQCFAQWRGYNAPGGLVGKANIAAVRGTVYLALHKIPTSPETPVV